MFIESEIILEVLFSSFRNHKSNFLMLWLQIVLEINDTPHSPAFSFLFIWELK